jgi:pimeloyl-ACP methyl ester carboxylesterase
MSFQLAGEGDPVLMVLNGFYLFEDLAYLAENRAVLGLDLRNRGRSEWIQDAAKLTRGVQQDVDDIEAVRRHFGIESLDLVAHSYTALVPILYAQRHPSRVRRIIQLSPMPPNTTTKYPAHLTNHDGALQEFAARAGKLQERRQSLSPVEFCRNFWTLLRPLYVVDPTNADMLHNWERCDLATELNFIRYWTEFLLPSIERLTFDEDEVARVMMPVLVIHGTKDRSAAYGGGRDWALRLPNARLLSVENAAHAPWVEARGEVVGRIRSFLDGVWPEGTEKVEAL